MECCVYLPNKNWFCPLAEQKLLLIVYLVLMFHIIDWFGSTINISLCRLKLSFDIHLTFVLLVDTFRRFHAKSAIFSLSSLVGQTGNGWLTLAMVLMILVQWKIVFLLLSLCKVNSFWSVFSYTRSIKSVQLWVSDKKLGQLWLANIKVKSS